MKYVNHNLKLIESETAKINIKDRGLKLGAGFFETILYTNRSFPAIQYHWSRLKTSADILSIALPFDETDLLKMLKELVLKNNAKNKTLGARLTITEGIAERSIIAPKDNQPTTLIELFPYSESTDSWSACIVETRRNEFNLTSRIKTTSYLDSILAKKEAVSKGFNEAILLNTKGFISECATSNIFFVKNNQLVTPPISDGALPGTTRQIILDKLSKQFEIKVESVKPEDILLADEVFITNALMRIKPISKIDNKIFSTKNHITQLIKVKIDELSLENQM